MQQNLVLNVVIEELGRRIITEPVLSVTSTLLELFAYIFTRNQISEKQSLTARVAFRAVLKDQSCTLAPHLRIILEKLDPKKLRKDECTYVEICTLALELAKKDPTFNILAALSRITCGPVEASPNATLSEI